MTTTPPIPAMAPSPAAPPAPVVTGATAAARLFAGLAEGAMERAAVLYLDPKRRLLGRIDVGGGRVSVALSLRMRQPGRWKDLKLSYDDIMAPCFTPAELDEIENASVFPPHA